MDQIVLTIRQWVENVLGTYVPVTYEETLLVADVANGGSLVRTYTKVADGLAGVDWPYICTAALVLVSVYSVFRLLGVLLQSLSGGRRV